MSINSFGRLLRLTSYGESHGPMIGGVLDGVPPRISLTENDIQPYLDLRRPGQSRYTTQRQEKDQIKLTSGVFENLTTGTPIGLIIENQDQRSKDYGDIKDRYRPGHADYVYDAKYGIRDYRGGGRSSARETAIRVAAGAIARKIIPHIKITAGLIAMGPFKTDPDRYQWSSVADNPFFCPDPVAAQNWGKELDIIRKSGDSYGGLIEIRATNVPRGLGAPLYGKLDADIAAAMMSINAVKGVEIGDGMATAFMTGTNNADQMRPKSADSSDASLQSDGDISAYSAYEKHSNLGDSLSEPVFLSNHAGGILGGISSGQDIIVRIAIKPTSSIMVPQKSINTQGEPIDVVTKGRHDPCVGIRGVPVAEAMMALVLADHVLLHRGQIGNK